MPTLVERMRRSREREEFGLPLTPEQERAERSLLDDLYGGGLTGVSWAGNILDTPGSFVRAGLAGDSAWAAAADPEKRVYGRELWREYMGNDPGFLGGLAVDIATDPLTYLTGGLGALGKLGKLAKGAGLATKGDDIVRIAGRKALEFKKAADIGKLDDIAATALDKKNANLWATIGEEVAGGSSGLGPRQARGILSPKDLITYADDPLAAKSLFDDAMQAHAIKKKMGPNWRPSWFADQMDRRLGHHLRLQIPFTGKGIGVPDWLPTGKGPMDWAGQKLRWGLPGRQLARLVSADVRGAKTREFQEAAQLLSGRQELSRLNARKFVAEQATSAAKMSKEAQSPEAMRQFFETGKDPGALFSTTDRGTLGKLREAFGDEFMASLKRAQELGVPVQTLVDPSGIRYFPRFGVGGTPLASRPGMLFDPMDPSSLHRASHLKGVPGGTEQIRTIVTDPQVNELVDKIRGIQKFPHLKAGASAAEAKALKSELDTLLTSKYGRELANPDLNSKRATATIAAGGVPQVNTVHAKRFRDWMVGLEPEARRMGVFANHPFQDAAIRLTRAEDSISAAELVTNKMIQHSEHVTRGGSEMAHGVSLRKVMDDMHLNTKIGDEVPVHIQRLSDNLNAAGKGAGGDAASVLDEFFIPRDVYEELTRVNDFYKIPGVAGDMKKALDGFLTLTKAHLTTPFAAFAGRNFMSGQFRNYAIGLHGFRSMKQAHDLLVGKTVKGSAKIPMIRQMLKRDGRRVSDKSATELLRELVYKHDLLPATSYGVDPVSARAFGSGMPPQGLPGFEPVSSPFRAGLIGKWFGFGKGVTRNPFDVAGATKPRFAKGIKGKLTSLPKAEEVFQTKFGPVSAGVELNMWVEGMNRISPMIEGLKRGRGDNAVANLIKRAQVDYSARKFSSFERETLQRIFPFFKFRMGQFKFLPGHLAEKPGGAIHQILRASRAGRGEEIMPEHVSETAAMQVPGGTPLSPDDPETNRYLTGFGFMFEDPLAMAGNPFNARSLQSMGLEMASSVRPELKMPAELIAGQSFFQRGPAGGRPLRELGSPFEQIAQNLSGVPLEDRPFKRGGLGILDQLALNSPLSRYITTARQLTSPIPRMLQGKYSDAAKALLNLSTGLRFTDVTERRQAGTMRQQAEAAMRELPSRVGREHLQSYTPKRDIVGLVQGGRVREAAQAEALNQILRRLRVESRSRAKDTQERLLGGESEVERRQDEIDAIMEMLRRRLPVTSLY